MSPERQYPTFHAMGGDFDESRLALEEILLSRLGSQEEVRGWLQRSNDEFLRGALPEVVLTVDPDKVVIAAFHARGTRR